MDGSTLLLAILVAAFGYACGSVPVGVLVARAMGGPDPRSIGSGRTGTTNALRALGPRGAMLVVAGDLLKGLLPVGLAAVVSGWNPGAEAVAGVAAVVGSCRSVFLGFGGGRGVVTLAGTMVIISPFALLFAAPVFVGTLFVSRYMSLASLLGTAALPVMEAAIGVLSTGAVGSIQLAYAAAGAVIVWIAHADNIGRLLSGTERRFDFSLLRGKGAGGS